MLFADMSDSVAREIVWAFAAIIFALLQLWTRKTITDRDEAASKKVDEVKTELERASQQVKSELEKTGQEVKSKLEETNQHVDDKMAENTALAAGNAEKLVYLASTVADTHTLVNDRHGKALKVAMDLAKMVAEIRGLPEDKEAAEKAMQNYRDHESKQAIVDNKGEKIDGS